jgi:hypothetical protein
VGAIKEMRRHPKNTASDDWPRGWLAFEVANLSRCPSYITMTDAEKEAAKLPVTIQEMRDYIRIKGKKK